MSMHSRFPRPVRCARDAPAIVPPTGPESSVNTGFRRARCRGYHAPVGLHDMHGSSHSSFCEFGLETAEIALHDGRDVGVHHGRRSTFILAPFARHLVGERDGNPGQGRMEDAAGFQFMFGVGVGMQETHRDGIDVLGSGLLHDGLEIRCTQGFEYLAVPCEAPADFVHVPGEAPAGRACGSAIRKASGGCLARWCNRRGGRRW